MSADHLRVRDLPAEQRPREQLARKGAGDLKDGDLIAIILRTGSQRESALVLADRLLAQFHSLAALSQATVEQLQAVSGIGLAKAAQLNAAFELGRRVPIEHPDHQPVHDPKDAARIAARALPSTTHEHFIILCLDTRHRLIRAEEVSKGTIDASLAAPREIFRAALTRNSAAVILAHNHPSGDPTPSPDDLATTKRLREAGEVIGVEVVDHLILGRDGEFVSLRQHGAFD